MTYLDDFGPSTRVDVLGSYNLGANTFTMKLPIAQFIDLSDVPNEGAVTHDDVAQRPLDRAHAAKLAAYVLKGLIHAAARFREAQGRAAEAHLRILGRMGPQPYYSLQPVVANIPCDLESLNPKVQKNSADDNLTVRVSFPPGVTMWVIDGQHRRWAMSLVLEFLRYVLAYRSYPKKASLYVFDGDGPAIDATDLEVWREAQNLALQRCTVAIEAHIDLAVDAQRQLFHDLNNLGKSVSASMAFDFDSANPVNMFIKEVLIDEGILTAKVVEKEVNEWAEHDGSMARKDLVAINAILFLNKTNAKGATPVQVERMESVARGFWSAVSEIPGFGEPGAKLKTVAAQPVVLKALAKLTYDFAAGRRANGEHLETLLSGLPRLDLTHSNPMWKFYDMSKEQRAKVLPGLSDYLPTDAGNRDVGAMDDVGHMRFGAKHNDIYPIIGDMIRWRLGLPNRQDQDAGVSLEKLAGVTLEDLGL